jgi:hypothetical protein
MSVQEVDSKGVNRVSAKCGWNQVAESSKHSDKDVKCVKAGKFSIS